MDPDAVDSLLDAEGGPDTGDDSLAEGARVPHGSTDDPQILDFSANINPKVPEGATRVYQTVLPTARRYPADDYSSYRITAGDYVGCDPQRVVPTPGGLAAIRLAIQTTVRSGESVVVPTPSFGEYAREVRLQGAEPVFHAHDDLFSVDPADHAMVILCNPNNPTGDSYDPAALRAFAERCRDAETVVLADEAFLGFTNEPSLAGEDGVVVARSLTKLFGLPGLRAGFAVATGRLRDRLAAARRTWSLSVPAEAVGTYCMNQTVFVRQTRERVASERARMADRLADRFDVRPSDAPFLLLDAGSSDAVDEAIERARRQDIAVRDARTFRGLDSHFRVAVRLPEENDRLLTALGV
ncbi:threonine-phosphate decarboxylase [Halorientalis brevis]|uniref:Aminotransferase n=1 Tax=Halorientalis brevis TaxID=1126241 RepID=A0ABD6CCM1_9EURY|nr:threonine-phosphate decarboxylase [Halorientalis brevis]